MLGTVAFWIALSAGAQQQPAGLCDPAGSAASARTAEQAVAQRNYAAAVREYQVAYDVCPARNLYLLEISRIESLRRNFDPAIRAARTYIDAKPDDPAGHAALANAYFMGQRFQEALAEAGKALALDPKNAAALKLKGNAAYLLGKTDDAINTFLVLLEAHPNDEDGPYMLGRIYYQERRVDHAIGQFQRVLKVNPRSYRAYDNLGLCYEAQGDTETAIRHFLTAIKIAEKDNPDYDWAYANLASLLVEKGDSEKAFGAASKAADRNPYSARNFYLGGKALVNLEKMELALNWLQRSVALDPNYAEPFYLLARVYTRLGQEDKAKDALDRFRAAKAKAPGQRR